jgi:hypothetical protein
MYGLMAADVECGLSSMCTSILYSQCLSLTCDIRFIYQ